MIKVNRRDFLKGSVAIGVAGALSGTILNTLKPSKAHADETGTIAYTPTTCVGCTTWCAVEVKTQTINGIKRAIDIRGNQNSQRSNSVCPRGLIALQEAYDADRVKVPMRRTNLQKGRGVDPGFIPVSWDAALNEIAVKMKDMRDNGNVHKWAWLRGRYSYNRKVTYEALKTVYGSPNAISHSAICAEAENVARSLCVGRHGYDDYDLENCTYLIVWGADPVSSNRLVSGTIERLGARQNAGMKVVAVDPRLNALASKADRWLPVIPGQDGALALAMASYILSQNLWNKAFVGLDDTVFTPGSDAVVGSVAEKGTIGVVAWWNKVLKNCDPDSSNFAGTGKTVAQITGIDVTTIKQVAHDFATIGGETAISWMGPGVAMQPNGIYGAWAVIALNALVGSLDHKGGVIQAEPSNSYYSDAVPSTSSYTDAIASTGASKAKLIHYVQKNSYDNNALAMPAIEYDTSTKTFGYQKISPTARLAKCIIDKSPYETKMLVGAMVNHPFSCVGANLFEQALSGDMSGWSATMDDNAPPFVVDVTTHVSEFGMLADIILPAKHLGLEAKASTHQRSGRYKIHSLYNECITPVWPETKNAELEFPWLLAQALDAVGFSKLIDYYRTKYPADMLGAAPLAKTATAADFAEIAWKYHATKKGDSAANRISQFAVISAATYDPTGISSTVGGGNGITQATYATDYFDANGRGKAWNAAVANTGGWTTKSSKVEIHNPSSALQVFFDTYIKDASKFNTTVSNFLSACNYNKIANLVATNGEDNSYANMPNYEDPYINEAAGYTLTFIDYKSRFNREGRSANTPWYHEFKSCDAGDEKWKDVIKINPIDAANMGIADGDSVIVSSPSNTTGIECIAKLWQGVRPGTVTKAYGQGHWAYGRYASKTFGSVANGGNNNAILDNQFERLSGSAARNANTKVKIVKKP